MNATDAPDTADSPASPKVPEPHRQTPRRPGSFVRRWNPHVTFTYNLVGSIAGFVTIAAAITSAIVWLVKKAPNDSVPVRKQAATSEHRGIQEQVSPADAKVFTGQSGTIVALPNHNGAISQAETPGVVSHPSAQTDAAQGINSVENPSSDSAISPSETPPDATADASLYGFAIPGDGARPAKNIQITADTLDDDTFAQIRTFLGAQPQANKTFHPNIVLHIDGVVISDDSVPGCDNPKTATIIYSLTDLGSHAVSSHSAIHGSECITNDVSLAIMDAKRNASAALLSTLTGKRE
ncbi:MAG TPA: hypothetical protein VK779_04235 [Rhizomicrobium sp.]|jgi:hypothetical protein|nr:hypothetical protein [Rhizomicrobium sp.]